MDVSEYYNRAKALGSRQGGEVPELLNALNYSEENDHPSSWVPNVQAALINQFKTLPDNEASNELLALYIQGEIMENSAKKISLVKVGSCCLLVGLFFGWLLWS